MATHLSLSPTEAADRLAIRELVDAYARCADRRDAQGQMALFTEDAHFVVHMDARSPQPAMELRRREDLAPVFADLNQYGATTHFMGQCTVVLNGDRATREAYCIAHHVKSAQGKRSLFIASLRGTSMRIRKAMEPGSSLNASSWSTGWTPARSPHDAMIRRAPQAAAAALSDRSPAAPSRRAAAGRGPALRRHAVQLRDVGAPRTDDLALIEALDGRAGELKARPSLPVSQPSYRSHGGATGP